MYKVNLTESEFPAQQDKSVDQVSIGDRLRQAAAQWPQNTALLEIDMRGETERGWDYSELLVEVEKLALSLASRFSPRERVTIWSPNTPEWVMMQYACAMAGIVVVPANPVSQPAELRRVIEQSGSVGLFLVPEYRGSPMWEIAAHACEGLDQLREITNMDDHGAMHKILNQNVSLPTVNPGDPAMIQYTSGTTGSPKGAILSHLGLLNNARFYADRLHTRPDTIWANVMPMYHSSGCGMVTLGCLQSGCTMLIVKLFDPDAICRLIEREGVTAILAAPAMLTAILTSLEAHPREVSSVETFSCGGAQVPPELVSKVRAAFNCSFGYVYGLTETSPVVTQHHIHDKLDDVSNTVGQPLPQTAVSIRSLNNKEVVPLGTVGEICVKGYCTMLSYHNNAKATVETVDKDSWLHTGDLGVMDENGYLKIIGRVKELIVHNGEIVLPGEIENLLRRHPKIADVAVVAIPDKQSGHAIGCFFRGKTSEPIGVEELKNFCHQSLSPKITPTIWCRVGEFPMTGSRRIQKFAIRDSYLKGHYRAL